MYLNKLNSLSLCVEFFVFVLNLDNGILPVPHVNKARFDSEHVASLGPGGTHFRRDIQL